VTPPVITVGVIVFRPVPLSSIAPPVLDQRDVPAREVAEVLLCGGESAPVLFIADLLQPVHGLAIEGFLDGDVRHGGGRCSAVPVLHTRRKPDHISRPNFFDRAALELCPAATGRDNQGLAERMRMPRGVGARLEGDAGAERASWSLCVEQRIDADRAGKPIGRSLAGGL
jgi:hypothetical protein